MIRAISVTVIGPSDFRRILVSRPIKRDQMTVRVFKTSNGRHEAKLRRSLFVHSMDSRSFCGV